MKKLVFLVVVLALGCAGQEISQEPAPQSQPQAAAETPENIESSPPAKPQPASQPDEVPGSPVGHAVHTMEVEKQRMVQMIKLVEQLQQGDYVFDCNDSQQMSQALQKAKTFFGPGIFDYDDRIFWFHTSDGQKIGPDLSLGALQRGELGMFSSFKRLIVYQGTDVRCEFYVDPQKNELMVHRYQGRTRSNRNYGLRTP